MSVRLRQWVRSKGRYCNYQVRLGIGNLPGLLHDTGGAYETVPTNVTPLDPKGRSWREEDKPEWWNWHTRRIQNPLPSGMRVRLPSQVHEVAMVVD